MAFTPVWHLADQEEAFRLMYAAFTGELPVPRFPERGALKDPDKGLRWTWRIEPKPGKPETRLVKSVFSRGSSKISVTVPLDTIDVNDLGLAARDHTGRRFLCRQKIPNEARADATDKETFADGWTGKIYQRFPVIGDSSARYYYAVIPLDDGAEAILTGINDLLDGKKRLDSR
jgi:hypothetical protein